VASKLPNASPALAAARKEENVEHDAERQDTVGGVAEAGTGTGGEELEALYELIAWPLGNKFGHPYDAFKRALTEPQEVFAGMDVPPETMDILLKTIAQRLTPQPIKLRSDIELTCFKPAGIEAIKRALKAGEAVSTPTVPIKARLIAPPLYVLDTNATDKPAGVANLEAAIQAIQISISSEGGDLNVKMKLKPFQRQKTENWKILWLKHTEISGDEEEGSSEEGE